MYCIHLFVLLAALSSMYSQAMTTTKAKSETPVQAQCFTIQHGNLHIASIPLEAAKQMSPIFKHAIESQKMVFNISQNPYPVKFAPYLKQFFSSLFPNASSLVSVPCSSSALTSATDFLAKDPDMFLHLLDFTQAMDITCFDKTIFQVLPAMIAKNPLVLYEHLLQDELFCSRACKSIVQQEAYSMLCFQDPMEVTSNPDLKYVFSSHGDYCLVRNVEDYPPKQWTLCRTRGYEKIGFVGHRAQFSNDGTTLVGACFTKDGVTLKAMDLATKKELYSKNFSEKISDLVINAAADRFVLLGEGKLLICDMQSDKTTTIDLCPDLNYSMVRMDDTGKTALVATAKKFFWYNIQTGSLITEQEYNYFESSFCLVLSPDGSLLAFYRGDHGSVELYNAQSECIGKMTTPAITNIEFSQGNKYLIVTKCENIYDQEKSIVVYDISQQNIVHSARHDSMFNVIERLDCALPIFQDPAKQHLIYFRNNDSVVDILDLGGSAIVVDQVPYSKPASSVPQDVLSKEAIQAACFGPTNNTVLLAGRTLWAKVNGWKFNRLLSYNRITKEFEDLFVGLGEDVRFSKINNNCCYQDIVYKKHDDEACHALLWYGLQNLSPQQVMAISYLVEASNSSSKYKPSFGTDSWMYKTFKTLSPTEQLRLVNRYPEIVNMLPAIEASVTGCICS